jgi:hypothetical protein
LREGAALRISDGFVSADSAWPRLRSEEAKRKATVAVLLSERSAVSRTTPLAVIVAAA